MFKELSNLIDKMIDNQDFINYLLLNKGIYLFKIPNNKLDFNLDLKINFYTLSEVFDKTLDDGIYFILNKKDDFIKKYVKDCVNANLTGFHSVCLDYNKKDLYEYGIDFSFYNNFYRKGINIIRDISPSFCLWGDLCIFESKIIKIDMLRAILFLIKNYDIIKEYPSSYFYPIIYRLYNVNNFTIIYNGFTIKNENDEFITVEDVNKIDLSKYIEEY